MFRDKLISVIIPTFNRSEYLKKCLLSIVKQSFTEFNYEVIIVDNGSTDNTRQAAEEIIQKLPSHSIRYIYEPEPGLLSGRHRGALESEGEICIFIDDDIEADSNWLYAIYESFQDPSVQLVGGRNLPNYETEPPEWISWFWVDHPYGKFCGELSLLDFGEEAKEIDANFVWGLNFSIRRQALFDLGGFHPDCISKHLQHFQGDGETGLTIKANVFGYKAVYQPNALVWHQIPNSRMTYQYFENRYFYQGVCDSYTNIRKDSSLPNKNRNRNGIKYIKDKIRKTLTLFKQEIFHSPIVDEEHKLRARFNKSLLAGHKFHKQAVLKDPKLLEWIIKTDYWDFRLNK